MTLPLLRALLLAELMLQGLCYAAVLRITRGLAWWGEMIVQRAQRAAMRSR